MTQNNFPSSLFAIVILLPVLAISLYSQVFQLPQNLPIGVVNNEIACNFPLKNFTNCQKSNLSCRFVEELRNQQNLNVEIFSTFESAWRAGKSGKLLAILKIPRNFTEILIDRLDLYDDFDDDVTEEVSDLIEINLDNSHLQMTQFVQKNLQKAIERFFKKFLKECNFSERLARVSGIYFDTPIFGNDELTFADELFTVILMG